MFFNELKVLVFMRSDSRQSGSDTERRPASTMRGLGMGGCGWPPFDCHSRDDEEEYYGTDPRPRSLAFEDKEPKLQVGLDAVSLTSSNSSMRSPQCRICFQGLEQVLYISIHSVYGGDMQLQPPPGVCFKCAFVRGGVTVHAC